MKLKEKLAEEYGGKSKFIGDIEANISRDAFIAGFEKGREMSAEIAYSLDFDGSGDEIDYIAEEEV